MTHPDIISALRTGYPPRFERPVLLCQDCEGGIYEGDAYYAFGKKYFCLHCIEAHREVAYE